MNSLCPLYFKSTFNQGLIAVLCLMANQIKSYTKLCDLCSYSNCVCLFFFFFGSIPGIFAESNTDCRYDDTCC